MTCLACNGTGRIKGTGFEKGAKCPLCGGQVPHEEEAMKCDHKGCPSEATYRFTWPGSDEKKVCSEHAQRWKAAGQGIDLDIELLPLPPEPTDARNKSKRLT